MYVNIYGCMNKYIWMYVCVCVELPQMKPLLTINATASRCIWLIRDIHIAPFYIHIYICMHRQPAANGYAYVLVSFYICVNILYSKVMCALLHPHKHTYVHTNILTLIQIYLQIFTARFMHFYP